MLGPIGLAYSIWLIATGSPIFYLRARPTSTRPKILSDHWFRIAGGLYIIVFFLPHLGGHDFLLFLIPAAAYVVGLWRALSPKIM